MVGGVPAVADNNLAPVRHSAADEPVLVEILLAWERAILVRELLHVGIWHPGDVCLLDEDPEAFGIVLNGCEVADDAIQILSDAVELLRAVAVKVLEQAWKVYELLERVLIQRQIVSTLAKDGQSEVRHGTQWELGDARKGSDQHYTLDAVVCEHQVEAFGRPSSHGGTQKVPVD
eukprot:1182604-Prymnesium_polylepis.1